MISDSESSPQSTISFVPFSMGSNAKLANTQTMGSINEEQDSEGTPSSIAHDLYSSEGRYKFMQPLKSPRATPKSLIVKGNIEDQIEVKKRDVNSSPDLKEYSGKFSNYKRNRQKLLDKDPDTQPPTLSSDSPCLKDIRVTKRVNETKSKVPSHFTSKNISEEWRISPTYTIQDSPVHRQTFDTNRMEIQRIDTTVDQRAEVEKDPGFIKYLHEKALLSKKSSFSKDWLKNGAGIRVERRYENSHFYH